MKKTLFIFRINKIPFRKDDLDTIEYCSFVKIHKMTFVSKYSFENNISNLNLVKQRYKKIVEDKVNFPIILEVIEA